MRIRDSLQNRERAIICLVGLITAGIWISALLPREPVMTVTFLSVGQGDAIVVQTPKGKTVLIDAGPGGSQKRAFDAGSKVVVPYLRRCGVNAINAMIITHPHEDHVGGAVSVLQSIRVRKILDPGIAHPSGPYFDMLQVARDKKIPYQRIRRGSVIDMGDGVRIEVLHPSSSEDTPDSDAAINNLSAVLRVVYRNTRILLAADAECSAEAEMLSSCPDLSANVLKVAHHGSAQATSLEWLSAVNPSCAVISVGWNNQFGHPADATLTQLEDFGINVYRTDRHGSVRITTNGTRMKITTSRK